MGGVMTKGLMTIFRKNVIEILELQVNNFKCSIDAAISLVKIYSCGIPAKIHCKTNFSLFFNYFSIKPFICE